MAVRGVVTASDSCRRSPSTSLPTLPRWSHFHHDRHLGACPGLGHPNLPLLFAKVPGASQDAPGLPSTGAAPGLRPHGLKKFLRLNHAGVHINTRPRSTATHAGQELRRRLPPHIIHPSLGGDWSSYWALDFWCPRHMVHTCSLTAGYTLHLRPGPPNPLLIWHSPPN